ncbi:TPA: hypothetical protein EYH33_04625 [Candidatus Bipolaricaulota bacterium]|nr:hypothetical protein [Candidatus Bipolaricaulota bacterium]
MHSLARRAQRALEARRGLRQDKLHPLFRRVGYITPDQLQVTNYPRRPLAAFNPGAALLDDRVLVFPRLVFDYYSYTSSVGVFELSVEELLGPLPKRDYPTTIVLWPQRGWEVDRGCEDPRVSLKPDGFRILYTGVGRLQDGGPGFRAVLAFAELDREFRLERKGYFRVLTGEGEFVPENKDSALLEAHGDQATVLTRPMGVGDAPDMCWRGVADLSTLELQGDSLEPELVPEPWEHKVGWSTNAVPLGDEGYLVGWHGVHRADFSYRNGLALVDQAGRLLAVSDYLLAPQGLVEEYGDRSLALFGNGLLLWKDRLIWVGGVSDYCIGVFEAPLTQALSLLRRV